MTRAMFNDTEWDALRETASELGREHGTNAGTWVPVDDVDSARRWLRGMADGDPKILDLLPDSGLSGEWVDDFGAADLYRHLGIGPDDDSDDAELCTAYSDAFSNAVQAEVQRRAVYQLSGEDSESTRSDGSTLDAEPFATVTAPPEWTLPRGRVGGAGRVRRDW